MIRRLSCITLCILILTLFLSHLTFAQEIQNSPTFFSFLKNYLIAYSAIDGYNKHVLAAHTKAPDPTQSQQMPFSPPAVQPGPQLSDVSTYILNGVNTYRASLGLSSVQSSAQTCTFAAIRAKEITSSFSHNGFYNRVNNHTLPYTSWTRATENIAEAPDYKKVVNLWIHSPEHAKNMRDNTPYVCIMQSGPYYAYEGMRP